MIKIPSRKYFSNPRKLNMALLFHKIPKSKGQHPSKNNPFLNQLSSFISHPSQKMI